MRKVHRRFLMFISLHFYSAHEVTSSLTDTLSDLLLSYLLTYLLTYLAYIHGVFRHE